MNSISAESSITPVLKRAISIVAALALLLALAPAGADAKKRVKSRITADVFGIIDRHASVVYFYGGEVDAGFLNFRCMAGRRVVLFQVENGTATRVGSTRTGIVGDYFATLELPLGGIEGTYYAKVLRKTKRVWRSTEKLVCLPARTGNFIVEVPEFQSSSSTPVASGGSA